jgi:hypothetical protein
MLLALTSIARTGMAADLPECESRFIRCRLDVVQALFT